MVSVGWSPGNPFATELVVDEVVVFVAGRAAPQGSKRAIGKGRMIESSKYVRPWRKDVHDAMAADGRRIHGPVVVGLRFVFPRPKVVKDAMTGLGQSVGDGDKLTRAVWDALKTAGTIDDDSRVLDWYGSKRLAAPGEDPGVLIIVRPWKG